MFACQTKGPLNTILIINAIGWAVAMIGTATLLKGTPQAENVQYLLLTGWLLSYISSVGCARVQGKTAATETPAIR